MKWNESYRQFTWPNRPKNGLNACEITIIHFVFYGFLFFLPVSTKKKCKVKQIRWHIEWQNYCRCSLRVNIAPEMFLNVRWSKRTLCKTRRSHTQTHTLNEVVAAFIALYCLSVFPFYRWAMYPVLFLIRINLWIILLIASSLLVLRHTLDSFIN